jgi:putative phosphoribosyl transferase
MPFKNSDPVILALPRGGVPVGFEIAKALEAPLDVILVRKIGAPDQPELAIGAVADGPHAETVINDDIVNVLGIPQSYIEQESARQLKEIERRRALYLAQRPPVDRARKTAIVVDDGIATGATVRAALRAVKQSKPKRLVLAVPVAPPDTIAALLAEVDQVICLQTPTYLGAIGGFYADFHQVTDDEVVEMLRRSPGIEPSGLMPPDTAPAPAVPLEESD